MSASAAVNANLRRAKRAKLLRRSQLRVARLADRDRRDGISRQQHDAQRTAEWPMIPRVAR